jgi:hypothetical protein
LRLLLLLALGAGPRSLDEPLPGPDSPSTAYVLERLVSLSPSGERVGERAVALDCLLTPDQPETVGVLQEMLISAPLADVATIVEDFPHYVDLFPDLTDVHKVAGSEDGNRFVVSWEQKVPVFFVPNVRYETAWLVERKPARVTYRYRLKAKGTVRATDGFIVLEDLGKSITRYTELDFIDADTGPVPMADVWTMTLDGIYRSDVAIKLKAEHAEWSYPKLRAESDKLLDRFPTKSCFAKRHPR